MIKPFKQILSTNTVLHKADFSMKRLITHKIVQGVNNPRQTNQKREETNFITNKQAERETKHRNQQALLMAKILMTQSSYKTIQPSILDKKTKFVFLRNPRNVIHQQGLSHSKRMEKGILSKWPQNQASVVILISDEQISNQNKLEEPRVDII